MKNSSSHNIDTPSNNNNNNFLYYNSQGDSTFNCFFPLDSADELEVFVEQSKKQYLQDYSIEFLSPSRQQVKFNYLVGTENCPQRVTLKFKPLIGRVGSFNNTSYIKAESLNAEFNNIIVNQHYLQDNVERSVKVSVYNTAELILPITNIGKALIWDNEGNLSNSNENINESLETLLKFMDDVQENGSGGGGGGGEIGIIDAFDVSYHGEISANNVQDALDLLVFAANIIVETTQLKSHNVQDALIELTDAKNIVYFNQALVADNVKDALDNLDNKINDVIVGKIELTNQYLGIKHGLIAGELSSLGLSNFLQVKGLFKVSVVVVNQPLQIAFSKYAKHSIGYINQAIELVFDLANIKYYIYADLQSDGRVTVNYTSLKPYYLGYARGDKVDDSQKLLLDAYTKPSDWFNLTNYTMYNSCNQPLNRVYIGQVCFNQDGSINYLIANAYGDSYIFDVKVTKDKSFSFSNLFSTELVSLNISYKNVMPYQEDNLYSSNIHDIDSNADLSAGLNYQISNQLINGTIGDPYANLYFTSSTTSLRASNGYFRFQVKRLF